MLSVGSRRESGNEFQTIGAATENDRRRLRVRFPVGRDCLCRQAVYFGTCQREMMRWYYLPMKCHLLSIIDNLNMWLITQWLRVDFFLFPYWNLFVKCSKYTQKNKRGIKTNHWISKRSSWYGWGYFKNHFLLQMGIFPGQTLEYELTELRRSVYIFFQNATNIIERCQYWCESEGRCSF